MNKKNRFSDSAKNMSDEKAAREKKTCSRFNLQERKELNVFFFGFIY